MKGLGIFLILVIILPTIVYTKDVAICPDQKVAKTVLLDVKVTASATSKAKILRTARLPATGLFNQDINCVFVVDNSADKSGGRVELVGGGYNQSYVEFRFESEIGKGLSYDIKAYGL